jgi:membrane-bound lytic murein transglycosylase D
MTGCEPKQPVPPPDASDGQCHCTALSSLRSRPASLLLRAAHLSNAEQRRVQQVIAQVPSAPSRAGQAHYRKGQLVQAKSDFDSAVDMMLASGLDIKADPQLNDEFNRILDASTRWRWKRSSRATALRLR